MILPIAIFVGIAAGLLLARIQKRTYAFPLLYGAWLVILGFLPQLFSIYLPATRPLIPDSWASAGLLSSQILLLFFCWLNRRLSGIWLLAFGLILNLLVMLVNGGFMPVSPATASHIAPPEIVETIPLGSRLGYTKDVLLMPAQTHLEPLSDRFLLRDNSRYNAVFSLGDILIALGAFWLTASQGKPVKFTGRIIKEAECYRQRRINPPSL